MLNIEAKARTPILVTVSQTNNRNGVRADGGLNIKPMVNMVSGAASSITGNRRPNRERTLSDHDPIRGSAMASRVMLMARAAPTMLPDNPRTAV